MELNLSICVVTYRCETYIERFHRELVASLAPHQQWELLYFDNSPDTATTDALQRTCLGHARLWHDTSNPGFSHGNNVLIGQASHQRILLLNPDVFGFDPTFWPRLIAASPTSEVTFARLLNEDGSFQDCIGREASLARAILPRRDHAAIAVDTEVEMGIMAFMLASRAVFDRVGLLDEDYPLYAEDMDWCHRARKRGVRLMYRPSLVLTHAGGGSARSRWDDREIRRRKYAAERLFIDKHLAGPHRWIMRGLNQFKRWRVRP